MSDLIIVGTDTDAGKTTLALSWLAQFGSEYAYWKPLETGESDTEKVRASCPNTLVFDPIMRFTEAVAPTLAARREQREIPSANAIAAQLPQSDRPLLIETFGGPLSPLNERELQIELIRELALPCVLVTRSTIGAITRALTTLRLLRSESVEVFAVVLMGEVDEYAAEQIEQFGGIKVFNLNPPVVGQVFNRSHDGESTLVNTLDSLRSLLVGQVGNLSHEKHGTIVERDAAHVWHPYTPLRGADAPLPVVGAKDEFLELADGGRLIDAISSWWTILHGHREPRLMAALRLASERIDHVIFAGVTHPFAVELAEQLLKTLPWNGGRVFFSDNGSTAVEAALKMAHQFWRHRGERRNLFVGFEDSYHGDTFGAMSVGRDPLFFGQFEPLLFRVERSPVDANQLDDRLKKFAPDVAAVIIEPLVQGAGGMRMHSPDTLRQIADVCIKHNVLLIADEVMTAGRTGTWWAHTQAGISPDLICSAKTLAGGVLSLAATLVSPKVVAEFDVPEREKTFFHGHSFTGHPLACAVAVENFRILDEGDWLQNVGRINRRWSIAAETLSEVPSVSNVRVQGTVLACDVGGGGYLAEVGAKMRRAAIEQGVLLRPLGNVLYAMPPLRTSDASLDRIVEAMQIAARTT